MIGLCQYHSRNIASGQLTNASKIRHFQTFDTNFFRLFSENRMNFTTLPEIRHIFIIHPCFLVAKLCYMVMRPCIFHTILSGFSPAFPVFSEVFFFGYPGFCIIFSPFPEDFRDVSVSPGRHPSRKCLSRSFAGSPDRGSGRDFPFFRNPFNLLD